MLWCHKDYTDTVFSQKLIQIEPVMARRFQAYHDPLHSSCTTLVFIPDFKAGESLSGVSETKGLLAEFHPPVIERSGPMLFASDIDPDHHGLICDLRNLVVLGIIHLGYLLFFRFANLGVSVPILLRGTFLFNRPPPHRSVCIIQEAYT